MPEIETKAPPAPAITPACRRYGVRFWIVIASIVVLGVPFVLCVTASIYINCGFMNRSIEERLSRKFGTPARVGSIETRAFNGLDIKQITIDPRGAGEPLTIGATRSKFGLYDYFAGNRIRALTLDRPRIDLRYDPVTGW